LFVHSVFAFCCSNEKDVGNGIKKSGIPRSDIFVLTKVWGDGHGYENCKAAFTSSLKKYANSLFYLVDICIYAFLLCVY